MLFELIESQVGTNEYLRITVAIGVFDFKVVIQSQISGQVLTTPFQLLPRQRREVTTAGKQPFSGTVTVQVDYPQSINRGFAKG